MMSEGEIGRSIELAERLQSIVDGPALRAASDLAALSALTLPAPSPTVLAAIEQLSATQQHMTANLQAVSAQMIADQQRWAAGTQRIAEQIASSQFGMAAGLEALCTAFPAPRPSPRRRPYVPEQPPQPIKAVQVDSQITLEGLSHALAEGRLPVRDVMRLCLQHVPASKPGVKEPPIEEQLALVEGWYMVKAARGRKRSFWEEWETQDKYCKKMGISRATLNRYERTCRALGLI